MLNRFLFAVGALAAIVTVVACSSDGEGQSRSGRDEVAIATGTQLGVYYTAGLAIADLVNETNPDRSLVIDATAGSVYNIDAISRGEVFLGLAQMDRQIEAVEGKGPWKGNPQKELRFVCNLHPELIAIMARDGSAIRSMRDLRYKEVSLGLRDSGTYRNAVDVLHSVGIDEERDITNHELTPEEAIEALKSGKIDAFFFTAGHPNSLLSLVTAHENGIRFVPINNYEALSKMYPHYKPGTIPISYYPGADNDRDVRTVGIETSLLASARLGDDYVYLVTKSLFEGLSEFKAKHPAFIALTRLEMSHGNVAPIHPGALRYYREVGLVK